MTAGEGKKRTKDEIEAHSILFACSSGHLHGEVGDLVQPLDVLVVRRVPQGRVAQEQAAQHVRVTPREHFGELGGWMDGHVDGWLVSLVVGW